MAATAWLAKTMLAGGALLAASGCGGPSRAERAMAEKDSQIATLRKDNALTHEELAAQQQQAQAAQQQTKAAMLQNELLAKQNGEIIEKNGQVGVATQAKVDQMSTQIDELQKKLATMKMGSDVTVVSSSREKDGIVISVAGTTLCDSGKADLKPSAYPTLNKIAETIKAKYPNNFIRIEGHTDSTPIVRNKEKFADNMELSTARAKAVFDYLVTKAAMPASKMYTAGFADKQPIAWPEKTAAERMKNRRVDIVILPNVKVEKQALAHNH